MSQPQTVLDGAFRSAFGGRFNPDLIDLAKKEDLRGRGETVVNDLARQGVSANHVAATLQEAVRNWGPAIIQEFCDASDVDWSFDAEAEADLRLVIRAMLDAALERAQRDQARMA